VLDKTRRVIADEPLLASFGQAPADGWHIVPFQVDWHAGAQQSLDELENRLLETTLYQTTSAYDALNRIRRMRLPADVGGTRHELRPAYNRAGSLEQVWMDDTLYVERIAYDAKGQRTLLAYGNGIITRYAHDPQSFRLKRLRAEHYTKPDAGTYQPTGAVLQDYAYDHDLAGNIFGIRDRTPGSGILNNPEAMTAGDTVLAQLLASGDALNRRFDYDPIYRLLSATGRECDRAPDSQPWDDQPRCTDLTRTRAYTEYYHYDALGNIQSLEHRNDQGGFIRAFTIETASNRLTSMGIGQDSYAYTYDGNGNTCSETASRHFEWNHADQMNVFRIQTAASEPSLYVCYLYDAAGRRVKKLVRAQGGQVESTHYIDGVFEYHRWGSGAQAGQNNHVHVIDDRRRLALVRFGNAHPKDNGPAVQFHLADHLGSCTIVVDSSGALVNREEFTPYGETSFGSFARKRYRFIGVERDAESGLAYHGARYYIPAAARWLTSDPSGLAGGINCYCYAASNPIRLVDTNGMEPEPFEIKEPEISIKGKVWGGALVDKPITDAEGADAGHVSLGQASVKISIAKTNKGKLEANPGIEATLGVVDAEINANVSKNLGFNVTGRVAKAKVSVSRKGITGDVALFEAGVGAKVGPVKGKLLFGLSAGIGLADGKLRIKAVAGIGGEIELDVGAIVRPIDISMVRQLAPHPLAPPALDLPMAEETSTRTSSVAYDDPPPPPRPRPHRNRPHAITQSAAHGCEYGSDWPGPHGKPYPGASPLR
jgi:RHS repeat-associated protein